MKGYIGFLRDLQVQLVDAIAECERFEFHHKKEGSDEWKHYIRLLGWAEEVEGRIAYYYARKKTDRPEGFQLTAPESSGVVRELHSALNDDGGGGNIGDK